MAHIGRGTYRAWHILGVAHIGRGSYGGKVSLTYESSLEKRNWEISLVEKIKGYFDHNIHRCAELQGFFISKQKEYVHINQGKC